MLNVFSEAEDVDIKDEKEEDEDAGEEDKQHQDQEEYAEEPAQSSDADQELNIPLTGKNSFIRTSH